MYAAHVHCSHRVVGRDIRGGMVSNEKTLVV